MPSLPKDVGGFTVGRKIGSGSFGDVYEGRRGRERVAIKLEPREDEAAKTARGCLQRRTSHLRKEWKFYSSLKGGRGIPKVYWYGSAGKHHKGMVLELLGESLEDLFKKNNKRFSLKTVLLLADQMIERLQMLHSKGILHCDVKPNNFLIGRGRTASRIYLVDFGLSRRYLDIETGHHIPYRDGKTGGLTGTARYTSIANHQGVELTRRDDFEGLAYVLVRMLRGTLPWQGLKAETKPLRNELIKASKLSNSVEDVCLGCPGEFVEMIKRCRGLRFDEAPPYEELRSLMRRALVHGSHKDDGVFDWTASAAAREDASTSTAASSRTRSTRLEEQGRPSVRCGQGNARGESEDSRGMAGGRGARRHRSASAVGEVSSPRKRRTTAAEASSPRKRPAAAAKPT